MNTAQSYDQSVADCRKIFLDKTIDYGTSWRVLRTISVTDQIFIKAQRIRTLQEKKKSRVGDNIESEFRGIVNYAVIGLIQLNLGTALIEDLPPTKAAALYDGEIAKAKLLMQQKNHDYGEAWRDMSQESYTDLILVKLLRIRQILSNDGKTKVSEGVDANFSDILNYAIFALIMIAEGRHAANP